MGALWRFYKMISELRVVLSLSFIIIHDESTKEISVEVKKFQYVIKHLHNLTQISSQFSP